MLQASAVVNLHREGMLLVPTLRSLRLARERASTQGGKIEMIAVADRADAATMAALGTHADLFDQVHEVGFGDLGAAREYGIAQASHTWVFMHDGDDLFSSNWYAQFLGMMGRGQIDDRTVYHTELFARFGHEIDIRRMIDSWDVRFHPLFLASEWYFSNKAVVNRRLFDEIPMPYNDRRTGIGNEDWTWSSHTLARNIRHSTLPETICFYRTKPQAASLGLTPGMIHDASPLFDPTQIIEMSVRRSQRRGMARGFAPGLSARADPVLGDGPPPDWFWREVDVQSDFESLLTEYRAQPPGYPRVHLPNLHYNVASATEYLMRDLDERPKMFLFASAANLRGADVQIDMMLRSIAAHDQGSHQPVLILDEGDLVVSETRLLAEHGAKVIATGHLARTFRIDEWYFNRLLMRPLVQNKGAILIDLGSDIFARLFAEFHRVLIENFAALVAILPDQTPDPMSPARVNLLRNAVFWHRHCGTALPLLTRPALAETLRGGQVFSARAMPDELLAALDNSVRQRYFAVEGPPLLADLAPVIEAACALAAPLAAPAPTARDSLIEVRAIPHKGHDYWFYCTAGTWLPDGWVDQAAQFMGRNRHIGICAPRITASLRPDGQYQCRWHNWADPAAIFAATWEQVARGMQVPLAVLLTDQLPGPAPEDARALARALWTRATGDPACKAAAHGETVAIMRDVQVWPQPGIAP